MKILYAIQGTGNGHLARAEDIIPFLQKKGNVDIFVSGAQADLELAYPVTYRSRGLSFYFGKNGGVDIMKTINKNNTKDIYKEIRNFPIQKYDLIINDFEPISAWASRIHKKPCVSLSHQASLLSTKVPKPKHYDPVGSWILRNYAPAGQHVGFHFSEFDDNIFTPVIRNKVRSCKSANNGHYTVYLPAYDDRKLVPLLIRIPGIRWHVFSKHTQTPYHVAKVSVYPINNEAFTQSMATSEGILCGAGFETPAEALFLKKKLMIIPMKKQYEQHYNAAALKEMGIPVLKKLKKKHLGKLCDWIDTGKPIDVEYGDVVEAAINRVFSLA
jgi:uncharacterized protein (TIGR00661 family)